jgi:large subunit ribosomal protein L24
MNIKKEDKVQVITGKDKGKRGSVQTVSVKDRLLTVEGVNIIKRHVKANPTVRQSGIIQYEAPISVSKVMLVCGHCDKAVRVGSKVLEDGKKVRICRSCQEVMD